MLLATKLRVPSRRPDGVPRPRLVERLEAGSGRELTLVCGPAGFGKSSVVADWVRTDRRAAAWLSLDEGDNDPVRFWRHLVAALGTARPGVADRAGALVGGPASAWLTAAVTALVNDFSAETEEVLLVLDDYHVIQSLDVHRSLEMLVGNLPPSLRLVLASRSDPPLPLARLRARGRLVELRASDLRFTRTETAELLRAAMGHEVPDPIVSALGERTEGWIAGLQLAILSLHGRDDPARFVEEFSGSHRFVLDYLAEEVLDRQPARLRAFLLESSVLEQLSGPLCDAVLGRGGSQQVLETLERENLFLLALDDTRRWWRYHHLFADLLRARMVRQSPSRVAELHRAAAAWHERHGLADDAIRHALAAGDSELAARLVERHLDEEILGRAEGATLTRWLTALPPDVVHRHPRIPLGQAVLALMSGQLDEVEPLLAVTERAVARTGQAPFEPSIDSGSSMLANVPAAVAISRAELARLRGDGEGEGRWAEAALTHLGADDELLESMARYHVAAADWHAGNLEVAERALVAIVERRITSEEHRLALRGGFDLGAVQQAQGRLSAALRTYQRGLEVAASSGSPPNISMAQVGLAEVLYERDELAAATEQALAGIGQSRQLAYAPPLVAGLLVLTRIRRAEGDPAGASAALAEAETVMPQVLDPRNPVPALRARLALADGNLGEAANWVRGRGLAAEDEPVYRREPEYLVLIRVLLAGQGPRPALEALDRWHALAVAQGRVGSVIPLRVLAAVAHAADGDQPAALAALAEALVLAAPERAVRPFADEGAPVAALLRELLIGRRLEQLTGPDAVPREFLGRLTEAFDRQGLPVLPAARRGAVTSPGLVEPLSPRELEVLALLAAGHRNQVIADRLFIGLDTVKRHVTNILTKLGVSNRTQAVARARELGLLA
ncbi:MAG TPA: LuxR C-terminal-related transcriptional regulator [Pseudonocardia sp.]